MKVLVVGLGGIGQRHVRNLRRLVGDDVEILVCRTRRLSHVLNDQLEVVQGDVEAAYGLVVCENLATGLRQHPDAVFICNPTSLHVRTAQAAAEAGCHLFIEKPLSDSWDGVDELIATVEERGLVAMVGYQLRFHPCLHRLRSILQAGALGRVLAVRVEVGEYLPGWHRYEDYRKMYASRRDLGGGVVLSQIHEMDYLYWLFGLPSRVFALGGHLSHLEIDVEDVASILFEYRVDGRCLPAHVQQDYLQRPPSRRCEVVGECGKATMDLQQSHLQVTGANGEVIESFSADSVQRNDMFLRALAHFMECAAHRRTPVVTVRDGAASLRMALAARESLEIGQPVALS